jgi:hypothetical protein
VTYGACDVLYGIVVAPCISELAWNRGERSEWRGNERQEKKGQKAAAS